MHCMLDQRMKHFPFDTCGINKTNSRVADFFKPKMYSPEELADIHLCYGYANCVATAAQQEYGRRFPDRRLPSSSKSRDFCKLKTFSRYLFMLQTRLRQHTAVFAKALYFRQRLKQSRIIANQQKPRKKF